MGGRFPEDRGFFFAKTFIFPQQQQLDDEFSYMTSADRASLHFALVVDYSSLDEILYLDCGISTSLGCFTGHPIVL